MVVISKAIVIKELKICGSTVYELDNVTKWKLVDTPHFSGVDKEISISKKGANTFMQFKGSNDKFVVDEI